MNRDAIAKRMAWVACCVLTATVCAMPTKQQLAEAQPIVNDLTADDLRALKAKEKTPGDVAAAHLALADEADTEAGKYLLLQGAFRLYARSGDYDAAAATLQRMRGEIAELPPEVIVEIVNSEMRRVADAKAPKVLAIFRDAQRMVKYRKQLAAAELDATAHPENARYQRRVAECHACLGDWSKALEIFAKIGDEAAKWELGTAKDCDAAKAADFWWSYKAADVEPFKAHAASLYKKGLEDGSITGLRKTLAEKRVKEMESGTMVAKSPAARVTAPTPVPTAKGKVISVKLAKGGTMDFMPCPAGTFTMGVSEDAQSAKFKHTVTITRPFWIGKYQVTKGQWQVFEASDLDDCDKALGGVEKAKDRVRYADATAYCNLLTKKYKRYIPQGYVYRLPTEAEWEYALHANCSDENDPYVQVFLHPKDVEAWKKIAVEDEDIKQMAQDNGFPVARLPSHVLPPMKVGTKLPNSWGVYDMLGNGVELLLDTVQIDNFEKRWGRNEHINLHGLLKYKAEETDPLRMVSSNPLCPCCLVRRKSKASHGNPLFDKMAHKVPGWVEIYSTFRVVIGPDLLKERGIKLPKLGK